MTRTSQALPMPPKLPPHVYIARSRGREYYYLQQHRGTERQTKAIRLPDDPRSPEFFRAYAKAINAPIQPKPTNTVAALDEKWAASPEWKALSPKTALEWTRYRKRIVAAWGDLQVKGIAPKHVVALRDQFASQPASANNLLRCLSSMLAWSVPRGWRADNPCRDIRLLKGSVAYEAWPWDVIEAARDDLIEIGRADLWHGIALALYTGQRLGDCLDMRWSDIRGNTIRVTQNKTGKKLVLPMHEELRGLLDQIPRTAATILTTSRGTTWQSGFQASWRKLRPKAVRDGGYVFHGLRKSAVVFLLEAGCSEAEVAAVTGQSLAMVAHYAKQVRQEHLAAKAILKWEQSRSGT